MKKNILIAMCTSLLLLTGCEKKEYWDHQTPENPTIAHLMCIEITKVPENRNFIYNTSLINAESGQFSDRFQKTSGNNLYSSSELPIKLYIEGGQRLDRETYIMAITGFDTTTLETTIFMDSIPEFRNHALIYKTDTIGLPTEFVFDTLGYKGIWYFRFD